MDSSVQGGWRRYVSEQEQADLAEIISVEKLKPEETRKFMANAFRDGAVKTTGTDIDRLMPPVSRFGGGNRAKKKQGIIEKLKAFFEKYFGFGMPMRGSTISLKCCSRRGICRNARSRLL